MIVNLSEKMLEMSHKTTAENQSNLEDSLEKQALKCKSKMQESWDFNLKKRRHHFWQKIRNENIASQYEVWLSSQPILIPCEFQMKYIEGESENETKLREKMAIHDFQMEKELMIV